MTTKIITVEATPPAESTGADYYKGAPLNAAEFDQNLVNLRAAVDRKASLSNPTFTGTVVLPATTSIGDVSATELQYLNSVTSNVQDQINAKAPINNPTFTGTVSLSTGTANGVLYLNGSKQVTSGSGLVFDSSGNLGIGTASPSYKLDVTGSANAWAGHFLGSSTSGQSYGLSVDAGTNSSDTAFQIRNYSGSATYMKVTGDGNLLVGTTSAGSTANAVWMSPSTSTIRFNNTTASGKEWSIGSSSPGVSGAGDYLSFARYSGSAWAEYARIDSSGNLLVGTTTAYDRLTVAGSIALPTSNGQNVIYSQNTAASETTGYLSLGAAYRAAYAGDVALGLANSAGNASKYVRVQNRTNGVYMSDGATSWTSASDERIKDIIEPITNAVEKVSSLRSVIGKYKTDEEGTRRSFLIAQDVQAVLPEAVNVQNDEQGTLGLQYSDVIPLLVAAIKELTQRIEALEYKGE